MRYYFHISPKLIYLLVFFALSCVVLARDQQEWSFVHDRKAAINTVQTLNRPQEDVLKWMPSTDGQKADWVKKVHIIFMNHLDVGYDSIPETGFVNNILWWYFHEYFPRAAKLAQNLTEGGYVESFIYTTHPWLVSLYLHCPEDFWLAGVKLLCPNDTQVSEFRDAVQNGYITWHASAMNFMMDSMTDESLFEFSLSISQSLDLEFGIERNFRVMSQRDVPGLTQAAIPSLLRMGVRGISVGVNPMTPPPAVPKLFRWRYGDDEVYATWHAGGYPDNAGGDPAHPGGLSLKDCVVLNYFDEALCFAFRTDNSGPPTSVQELLGCYEILRAEFPNAQLAASTLGAYFESIEPIRITLPVLTKEIGDTWVQGISSDPRKLAEYRAVARVLKRCVRSKSCNYNDERVFNASRFLIKLPEHTYGLPDVGDTHHWSNTEFQKVKSELNFVNCTLSWLEQRNFTYYAISALNNHPIVEEITEELKQLVPKHPSLEGFRPLQIRASDVYTCDKKRNVQIGFDKNDGSINFLAVSGIKWATPMNPLGQFLYVTYNETDFDNFGKLYNYNSYSAGYYKQNVTKCAHPESRKWNPTLKALYVNNSDNCDFYVNLKFTDETTWTYYGAPTDIWIHVSVYPESHQPGIAFEVQWFNKTATRLPEAFFFTFQPVLQPDHNWLLSKLGHFVDPMNVILNGSQYQHGVDDNGVFYLSSSHGIQISSLDVPVVCPISDRQPLTVFPAPLQPISGNIIGMSYNIYNNIWDTNFIFWYPYIEEDKNFKARFEVNFISK